MTTVKTYLRVRPQNEAESFQYRVREMGAAKLFVLLGPKATSQYAFEDVFEQNASQEEVYAAFGEKMLETALSGMNYLLMSYGQTGAGKSYTMLGEPGFPGIIPRFLTDLFIKRDEIEEEGQLDIEYSFFEIYKERIYDCLCNENKPLSLREQPNKRVLIEGLSTNEASTVNEVLQALHIAISNRRAGETFFNKRSSRSHFIISLNISLKNKLSLEGKEFTVTKRSQITFVDLAGSERQAKNFNDTLEEGCAINKSLSVLSHIVSSLAKRSRAFLHFRDSKLTHLLKDSFCGDAHISILTNILGSKESIAETISTLGFASAAQCVRIDPHFNVESDSNELFDVAESCRIVRKEIAALNAFFSNEATISHLRNMYDMHILTASKLYTKSDYAKTTAELHTQTAKILQKSRKLLESQRNGHNRNMNVIDVKMRGLSASASKEKRAKKARSTIKEQYLEPTSKTSYDYVTSLSPKKHKNLCLLKPDQPTQTALETLQAQQIRQKDAEIAHLKRLLATREDTSVVFQTKRASKKLINIERQLRNRNKDYLSAVKEISKLKLELSQAQSPETN